jgi:hypothetical protein
VWGKRSKGLVKLVELGRVNQPSILGYQVLTVYPISERLLELKDNASHSQFPFFLFFFFASTGWLESMDLACFTICELDQWLIKE